MTGPNKMDHGPCHELPLVDPGGRVALDVPCLSCGYDLRSQPALGRCPECAAPVEAALRAGTLRFADPAWLDRQLKALVVIIAGAVAAALLVIALVFPEFWQAWSGRFPAVAKSHAWYVCLYIGAGAVVLCWAMATLRLGRHAPSCLGAPPTLWAGRTLRACGGCMLACGTVLLAVVAWDLLVLRLVGRDAAGLQRPNPYAAMTDPLYQALTRALLVLALVVLPLALLRYTRALLKSIPRRGMARWVSAQFWLCLLLLVCMGTLHLLERYAIGQAMAPSWPMTTSGPAPITTKASAAPTSLGYTTQVTVSLTGTTVTTSTIGRTALGPSWPAWAGTYVQLLTVTICAAPLVLLATLAAMIASAGAIRATALEARAIRSSLESDSTPASG